MLIRFVRIYARWINGGNTLFAIFYELRFNHFRGRETRCSSANFILSFLGDLYWNWLSLLIHDYQCCLLLADGDQFDQDKTLKRRLSLEPWEYIDRLHMSYQVDNYSGNRDISRYQTASPVLNYE